jgi:hypothetical protein
MSSSAPPLQIMNSSTSSSNPSPRAPAGIARRTTTGAPHAMTIETARVLYPLWRKHLPDLQRNRPERSADCILENQ